MYLPNGYLLHQRYSLETVLGHGGFGITYAAHDQLLKIKVAIKEYFPRQLASRSEGQTHISVFSGEARQHYDYGLRKFLEEAQALARFTHHPNIVSPRDYFEANGTAYMVMEYVEGVTLKDYLERKGGKISYPEALTVMLPVMTALQEVHQMGLLHRDISPDNILLTTTGQVKILDFGAARYFAGEQSKSLSIILKAGYAPEEQYRSKGQQGPWTDVYACAATFYRAITGQTPPDALDRLAEDTLIPPSRLGVAMPSGAEQGLLRGLAVRAEQRLPDMPALRHALTGAGLEQANVFQTAATPPQRGQSLASLGPSAAGALIYAKARRRILAAWLAAFSILAILGGIFLWVGWQTPAPTSVAGPARGPERPAASPQHSPVPFTPPPSTPRLQILADLNLAEIMENRETATINLPDNLSLSITKNVDDRFQIVTILEDGQIIARLKEGIFDNVVLCSHGNATFLIISKFSGGAHCCGHYQVLARSQDTGSWHVLGETEGHEGGPEPIRTLLQEHQGQLYLKDFFSQFAYFHSSYAGSLLTLEPPIFHRLTATAMTMDNAPFRDFYLRQAAIIEQEISNAARQRLRRPPALLSQDEFTDDLGQLLIKRTIYLIMAGAWDQARSVLESEVRRYYQTTRGVAELFREVSQTLAPLTPSPPPQAAPSGRQTPQASLPDDFPGHWRLAWRGGRTNALYQGSMSVRSRIDDHTYNATLLIRTPQGQEISQDALISIQQHKVIIRCSNPSSPRYPADNFFLERSGNTMRGFDRDEKGNVGYDVVFTAVE